MTVKYVVSAGHNAEKVGATTKYLGKDFSEWPNTLEWARTLRNRFPNQSEVMLLENMGLSQKIRSINELKPIPHFALEIHFNSSTKGGKGSETLFTPFSEKSKLLAGFVQAEMGKVSQPDRKIKEGWYKQDYERRIPDGFLSQTKPVAIILEPFFIQQPQEILDRRNEVCDAIYDGLRNYMKLYFPEELL